MITIYNVDKILSTSKNYITTDDLAFSAYLKLNGYQIIKSNHNQSKSTFTFDLQSEAEATLKVKFINSEYLKYYNEIRNIKKLI